MHSIVPALCAAVILGTSPRLASAQGAVQSQAYDPSPRLREVLPADVAERVLAKIAEARSRGLPAQALERTALKGAARNVPARDIERAVNAQENRLARSQDALAKAPGRQASGDEIEAGAEALRNGADGKTVSALAKSAPSGRSLAVPLHVLGSLVERGLPSDEALSAVVARLEARAADEEIAALPEQVGMRGGKPALTGPGLAATKRPGAAGGAPTGVPSNAGGRARPETPVGGKPTGRP
jgi:hypothetical protein